MSHAKKNIEIELLRGLSVLLVFLFHLRLPWFHNGYFGVDIFFVISGYLMALLYGNLQAWGDIKTYYMRRLNRVLPAYYAVLFATIVAGALLTLPHDLYTISGHGIWSAVLMPNIGFWMDTTYFDNRIFRPFLNLWSLGVEIQFYAVVPLVAFIFLKLPRLFPFLIVLGFIACIIMTELSAKTSFFMMPLRGWEFLIGFYAAKLRLAKEWKNPFAWVLGMIVLGVVLYLPLDPESHPGFGALAVSLAAAVIIFFGMPERLKNNGLSTAVQVLGKYSYSIYLVHFPIIAFLYYGPFEGTYQEAGSLRLNIIATFLTGGCAFALYHLVEARFRIQPSHARAVAGYAGVCALILLSMPALQAANKMSFTTQEKMISMAWFDQDVYRCGKLRRITQPFSASCVLTKQASVPGGNFLLVGDSHADALKKALADVADEKGVSLRFMKQNAALGKGYGAGDVLSEAQAQQVNAIIVHSSIGAVDVDAVKALAELAAAADIKVAFIDPLPGYKFNVPQYLFERAQGGEEQEGLTLGTYEQSLSEIAAALSKIKAPNFHRYKAGKYFCDPDCAMTESGGALLYFDSHHLTLTGARRLRDLFGEILESR